MLRLTRSLAAETGAGNLCLAGGVALNCVANGKVLRDGAFREHLDSAGRRRRRRRGRRGARGLSPFKGQPRSRASGDGMSGAFSGPAFAQAEIETRLHEAGARFDVAQRRGDDRARPRRPRRRATRSAGSRAAWNSGRARSAPARSSATRARRTCRRISICKVKYRESFRPFAPSVLREDVAEWFELDVDSPYMLLVADVAAQRKRRQ